MTFVMLAIGSSVFFFRLHIRLPVDTLTSSPAAATMRMGPAAGADACAAGMAARSAAGRTQAMTAAAAASRSPMRMTPRGHTAVLICLDNRGNWLRLSQEWREPPVDYQPLGSGIPSA